jgi:hypothetical protein
MKNRVIKNILLLLFGLALLNGCLYLQQPSMIFFPYATLDQTPAEWGLAYEDVFLDAEDGVRLHGWYIPHYGSQQTLLFSTVMRVISHIAAPPWRSFTGWA